MTEVLIRGDERIETFGLGAGEQLPVLEVVPTPLVMSYIACAGEVFGLSGVRVSDPRSAGVASAESTFCVTGAANG